MSKTRLWFATLGNFFLPGVGYLVTGGARKLYAPLFILGAMGLTWVEFGIQTAAPTFYWPMFASVFVMNTGFAIDAYREAKAMQSPETQSTPTLNSVQTA